MQRPNRPRLPHEPGLSGRPTAEGTTPEGTAPERTAAARATHDGTAPDRTARVLRSTDRRSLLRGGLAVGAAAGAALAGDLWTGAGSANAADAAGAARTAASAGKNAVAGARAAAVDYTGATWEPASTGNYTAASRPTTYPIELVVIHVTQETFADTISLFQDPAHAAAAHYVVRSADGHIDQCVREHDVAWHAGNWDYNTRSIGIEHEGWVDDPSYFTTAMYHASAALTSAICDRYGIPKDRNHILGHSQIPGTDHTDPGSHWDWVRYIRLVNGV